MLSRTLTFAAGSAQGSSQCTNIDIVDDNFLEVGIGTFFADLTTDPNITQVDPTRSQATITIQDNDMSKRQCIYNTDLPTTLMLLFTVIFDIQNPSYIFPEANAMQSVCVVLASGSAQLSSDTLISFQSIPGSGTATGAYTLVYKY